MADGPAQRSHAHKIGNGRDGSHRQCGRSRKRTESENRGFCDRPERAVDDAVLRHRAVEGGPETVEKIPSPESRVRRIGVATLAQMRHDDTQLASTAPLACSSRSRY
jgi:hypothetical protein